ncbi:MAG: arginine repressor [Clostridiales bacterium]|jgi:transcriptional regulator of arginine metabolism|nr:arginine repressor [Clostridiales bacterium]
MARADRQSKILEIIAENNIDTQDGLTERLKACGYDVTQATVSRDIKELGLVKTAARDGYKYVSPVRQDQIIGQIGEQNEGLTARRAALFKESVVGIDCAENIIVIKTISGSASSAAALIDSLKEPSILGSVAGDDTIFVVVKSVGAAKGVAELFGNLCG